MHVRRHSIKDLPTGDEPLEEVCHGSPGDHDLGSLACLPFMSVCVRTVSMINCVNSMH